MENQKSVWEVLSSIDCTKHIEKKNGLNYLSWAWAWGITKSKFSSANYKVIQYEEKPFFFDPVLGYMVSTEVTIEGETIPMNLPVLDGANKAMNNKEYEYNSTKWVEGKKVPCKKVVQAASMFDINTAIMRCLTKNIALFGLGHYIYAGEDLPSDYDNGEKEAEKKRIELEIELESACSSALELETKEEIAQHWKTNIKFQKEQAYIDAIKQVGAKIQKEEPKGVIENARDFVYNFLNKEENEISKIEVLKKYKKSSIETLTDKQIQEIKTSINKK